MVSEGTPFEEAKHVAFERAYERDIICNRLDDGLADLLLLVHLLLSLEFVLEIRDGVFSRLL